MANKETALDRLLLVAMGTGLGSAVASFFFGGQPWHAITSSIAGVCLFLALTIVVVRFIRALDDGVKQAALLLVMAAVWVIGGTFIGLTNSSDSGVAVWLSWTMGAIGATLAFVAIGKVMRISINMWLTDRSRRSH